MNWSIRITCGELVGKPIPCTQWDVLSRLALVRDAIPAGWQADAYPETETRC